MWDWKTKISPKFVNSSMHKETVEHSIKTGETATVEFKSNFGNEEVGKK